MGKYNEFWLHRNFLAGKRSKKSVESKGKCNINENV